MALLSTTVGVVCVFGDQERNFINLLQDSIRKCERGLTLEYSDVGKSPILLLMQVKKYKERTMPFLVLISEMFLATIWLTSEKRTVLDEITRQYHNACIHVWLGNLSESFVKSYSTLLCRSDASFHRLKESEMSTPMAMAIENSIKETKTNHSKENYSISEFEMDAQNKMEKDFQQKSRVSVSSDEKLVSFAVSNLNDMSINTQSSNPATRKTMKSKLKHRGNVYSAASHIMSMLINNSEREKSIAVGQKELKNKRGKVTLFDLTFKQIHELSLMLDIGHGANWRQIAEYCDIDRNTILELEGLQSNKSPTQQLISLLKVRMPELTLSHILEGCKLMARYDVVEYINREILEA